MGRNDIIIVRIWEGLGNQLFQYAYARALKEKGLDVRLDLKKAYDETFEKDPRHDVRQVAIQNFNITLPEIDVEEYGKYRYLMRESFEDKAMYEMAKFGLWKYRFYEETINKKGAVPLYSAKTANIARNCYIKGWFVDERYFKSIRQSLLKEITPKERMRVSGELKQALEYEESVSLHVRRGDFVKTKRALDIGYYKKAISYIRKHFKEPLFLIFSEDLDWVRRHLNVGDNYIYINEDRKLQDYEELLIMSKCKYNIIANSTFSWWGAWLNRNPGKIIIAPKDSLPNQRGMINL